MAVSENVRFEAFFYSNFANSILCEYQSVNAEVKWNISCNFTGGIVYTSLTIISPLQAGLWKISIECTEYENSDREEILGIKIDVSGKVVLFYNCLIWNLSTAKFLKKPKPQQFYTFCPILKVETHFIQCKFEKTVNPTC